MKQKDNATVKPSIGAALPLRATEKSEALSFLAQRPLHTVYMASLLRDNGVLSPLNRGRLYGYRGWRGQFEGIALLGHATLIEARTEPSLAAFAKLAQTSRLPHLIRGEEELIKRFWRAYGKAGEVESNVCRELLLEQVNAPEGTEIRGLRQATLDDLESVLKINAEMAHAESGSDPMKRDPEGFRYRTARRITRGRNWIWMEDGKLLFKADIIADTPEVIYLEGVYVQPDERRKGYGSTCLAQLGRRLLRRTGSVCLTLNAGKKETIGFYSKAGYALRSYYDTIYLQPAH
jgi:predicted GNAT family acetyltransferase